MAFLKNLFIVLLVVAAVTAHQLNAMDWRSCHCKAQPSTDDTTTQKKASDFQIYQLLSATTKDNNPEAYLPDDVTKIIMTHVREITKELCKECYQQYGECLDGPGAVFRFIQDNLLSRSMSHTVIVNILKTCLSYSGKSLNKIKDSEGFTVLHDIGVVDAGEAGTLRRNNVDIGRSFFNSYFKTVCLAAGDQAWDLIIERNNYGSTVLHYLSLSSSINELLSIAPSREKAWRLINTPNLSGNTALSLAKSYKKGEILEIFGPKEQ